MAFTSVGDILAGGEVFTTNSSTGFRTVTNFSSGVSIGDYLLVIIAIDNVSSSTTDGDNVEITKITDSISEIDNQFVKLKEFSNTQTGSKTGATISVWGCKAVRVLSSSDGLVIYNSVNAVSVAMGIVIRKFSITGSSVRVAAAGSATQASDAADTGSLSLTPTPGSKEYLWVRATALETSSTSAWTADTNYTKFTDVGTTGGGAAGNMVGRSEFRIFTGTTQSTNPTIYAVDNASVFLALEEVTSTTYNDSLTFPTTSGFQNLSLGPYRDTIPLDAILGFQDLSIGPYRDIVSLDTTTGLTPLGLNSIPTTIPFATSLSKVDSCVHKMQSELIFNKTMSLSLLNSLNLHTLMNLGITQGFALSGLGNFQNALVFTTTSGLIVIANINQNSDLTLSEINNFDSLGVTSIQSAFNLPANMLMANESMLSVFPQLSLIHTSDFISDSSIITNPEITFPNAVSLDAVSLAFLSNQISLDSIFGFIPFCGNFYNESILLDSFIRISKIGGTGIFPNALSLDMISGFDQSMLFSTLGTMDLTSTFGINQSMLLSLTGGVSLNHSHLMTQRSILDAISNQTYELNTELMLNGVKITSADLLFALTGSLDQSHLYIANAGLILPVGMTQEGQSSADLNSNLALQTNIIFSQLASNLIVPVGIVLTNSQGLAITPLFSPLGVIQFDSSVGLGSTNTNTMNDSLNFPILNVLQPLGNIDISESTELDNTLNLSIGGERTLSLSTSFPVSISTNFDQELLISGVLTLNSSNSIDFLSILSTLDQSHLYFNQNFDVSPSVVLEKLIELGFSTEIINFSILNGLANALFSNSLSIQADSTNNMAASVVLPVVNDLANASKLAIELGLGYQFFASLGSQVSASVPTSVSLAVVSGFGASATLTVNAIAALVMSGSFTAKQFESFNTYNEALSFAAALSLTHQSILNGNATLVILTNHEMSLLNDNFRIDKNFNVVILEKNDLSFATIDEITIQGNSDKLELNEFKSEIEWTASDLKTL